MEIRKNIDRIGIGAVVLAMLLTILFANGTALGIQAAETTLGYENRLFDTTRVHTIDIVMDDWDSFVDTCESEEYTACAVVIDGESYQNVGIRGKGNTSLSSVSQMGSDRYSFKVEFDQYDSAKSYYGLDKLCLNNIIQDNTYLKDYLSYRLMAEFGVTTPLCSFVYITVNGEDWGLYLAVEGVEESFLQRNYASTDGQLYKPDSLSMGGGKGNGGNFDFGDLDFGNMDFDNMDVENRDFGDFDPQNGDFGSVDPSKGNEEELPDSMTPPEMPTGEQSGSDSVPQMPDDGQFGGGQMPPDSGDSAADGFSRGNFSMGGMGSSDVKLQYIDDDPDSYANIFDNAKSDVSDADKERLIASLRQLSAYENLEEVLDLEQVLRYFVVHNFVVNDDSYTGSMIHNYYLYEEDGRLSMIPWDYNLAFGGFQSTSATATVNEPIDDVLDDRPMQAWIFASESSTAQYHQLYAEFITSIDIQSIIDEAATLIAPYVEKDPTKFCTYEEFLTGVETLRQFCQLRCDSVAGQLDGTIPSTTAGQQTSTALIDGSSITISAMGGMNQTMSGGENFTAEPERQTVVSRPDNTQSTQQEMPSAATAGDNSQIVLLGVSLLVLAGGLVFAIKVKKK